jgi:hypothetical protein
MAVGAADLHCSLLFYQAANIALLQYPWPPALPCPGRKRPSNCTQPQMRSAVRLARCSEQKMRVATPECCVMGLWQHGQWQSGEKRMGSPMREACLVPVAAPVGPLLLLCLLFPPFHAMAGCCTLEPADRLAPRSVFVCVRFVPRPYHVCPALASLPWLPRPRGAQYKANLRLYHVRLMNMDLRVMEPRFFCRPGVSRATDITCAAPTCGW